MSASLSYDQATDTAWRNWKSLKPVEDPLWDEEERLREDYIKSMANVYDDDKDDF